MNLYALRDDYGGNIFGMYKYYEAADYRRLQLLKELKDDHIEPIIEEIEVEENGLPHMVHVIIEHQLAQDYQGSGSSINVTVMPPENKFIEAVEKMNKSPEFTASGEWIGAFTIQLFRDEEPYKVRDEIFKWYINNFNYRMERHLDEMMQSLRKYFYNRRVIGRPDIELVKLSKNATKEVTQNGE